MSDSSYERLPNNSVAWICLVCDAPSYSWTPFDLHDLKSSNCLRTLSERGDLSFNSVNSEESLGHPKAPLSPVKPKPRPSSGPRPLRMFNVKSLKKKKGQLYNLLDSTKPDIIVATETWFNDTIGDAEYFSSKYT